MTPRGQSTPRFRENLRMRSPKEKQLTKVTSTLCSISSLRYQLPFLGKEEWQPVTWVTTDDSWESATLGHNFSKPCPTDITSAFRPTPAMAPRASSPALSENEYDIGAALFGNDEGPQEETESKTLGFDLDVGANEDASDDEAFIAATQAASNRKVSNLKGKSVKKGGGFQAMGLNAALLKAITRKGFSVPTPIQRRAVPLILDGQDVVGMARTGSGKTAAFVIPMIQALKAHSAKFGARAVVLSPSRELALQTLKVVKELGRGTDLRTVLLVGGDSLDDRESNCFLQHPEVANGWP